MEKTFVLFVILCIICSNLSGCGSEEKMTTFTTDTATDFGTSSDTSITSEVTYMDGDKIEETSYETIVEGVGPLAPAGQEDNPKIKRAEMSPYNGTSFYREGNAIILPSPEEAERLRNKQ